MESHDGVKRMPRMGQEGAAYDLDHDRMDADCRERLV